MHPCHPSLYAGYSNSGFRSRDEEFSNRRGISITHILTHGAVEEEEEVNQTEANYPARQDSLQLQRADGEKTENFSPEIRNLLARNLPSQSHHPLHQVRTLLETRIRASIEAAGSSSCFRSFQPAVQNSSTSQQQPPSSPSVVHSNGGLAPLLRASSESEAQMTSSTFHILAAVDTGSINSVQWNLESIEAVVGDIADAVLEPAAIILQRTASKEGAMENEGNNAAHVPFMHGGVPLLHYLRVDFTSTENDSACADAEIRAVLVTALTAVLGSSVSIRFTSLAQSPSHWEALVRHSDGVWHSVAVVSTRSEEAGSPSSTVLLFDLEKLAILRWNIPDVRWLCSRDWRVQESFARMTAKTDSGGITPFIPFAMHTQAIVRDNSFWLAPVSREALEGGVSAEAAVSAASSARAAIDETAFVRIYTRLLLEFVGAERCCSMRVTDCFTHPIRGPSLRLRVVFNCVDRALSTEDVRLLQQRMHGQLIAQTGVKLR